MPKRLCHFGKPFTRPSTISNSRVSTFQSSLFLDARNEDSYRRAETGPQHRGFAVCWLVPVSTPPTPMLLSRFRPGPQPLDQPHSLPTMAAEWFHLPYLLRSSTSPPIVGPTYFQSSAFISLKAGSMGFIPCQHLRHDRSYDPRCVICRLCYILPLPKPSFMLFVLSWNRDCSFMSRIWGSIFLRCQTRRSCSSSLWHWV
jgi:hypothetical protein